MGIWYTTREDVMSAQDIKATAYSGREIDRAIDAGARAVEALLHRVLYPWLGSRYFDYPGTQGTPTWRIWFGQYDLISLTSVLNSDGTSIAPANLLLNPQDGPPYEYMEIDRGSVAAYSSGTTSQRAVAVTGLWGYTNEEELAGTSVEDIDISETSIDGSSMPTVGVGSVIRIDSERMLVVDKTWLSTAQTGSLTVQNNAQTLVVANGSAFLPGETVLLDAERMRVVDIAANNLIVKRAVDGSTLAAHTSATIFAQRGLTVRRGALGSTAAAHDNGASVLRWLPPAPAAELNMAYAINALLQQQAGYARTVGSGDNETEQTGRGIRALEKQVRSTMARQARKGVV